MQKVVYVRLTMFHRLAKISFFFFLCRQSDNHHLKHTHTNKVTGLYPGESVQSNNIGICQLIWALQTATDSQVLKKERL